MKQKVTKSYEILLEPDDVAYIKFPESENKKITKTINLKEIKDYKGCDLILDFLEDNTLVGIEILS